MNPLDLAIIATMIFLIIRGLMRGFFREIGSIAGVILGFLFANIYHPGLAEYIRSYLPNLSHLSRALISFATIFALVLILCNTAGWGLKLFFKKTLFGWADRTLGVGLAFLKGIIITYIAIVLITILLPSKSPLIAKSTLSPFIISSYQAMVSVISPGSYERWKKKLLKESRGWQGDEKGETKGPSTKNGSE
jgi:membrane protein required for colicin V production